MPLAIAGRPPQSQAVATVQAAVEAGTTLIDTADVYCLDASEFGYGEELLARVLARLGPLGDDVVVATKGGHTRDASGAVGLDGRPASLRRSCEASLRRLGVEAIGLYQFHRPDPAVPYAESLGAFAELREEGKVHMVGISNASIEQIETARTVLGAGALASVQNEFSPDFRSSEPELEHCARHGIAFLPWSPFGGRSRAGALAAHRPGLGDLAAAWGLSAHQAVLAWMLAKGDHVIPIPGASRPGSARDSAAAADCALSADQLAQIEEVL